MNCARRDQTLHHAHHGHKTNQETVAAKSANNVQQQSAEWSSLTGNEIIAKLSLNFN